MITGPDSNLARIATSGGPRSIGAPPAQPEGASFSDVLKNSIDEVSRLQQDASQAVQDLATGKTENLNGVMTAMEKSEMAFKTLLAIRAKLMDAYDEVKNISV
ncbi:MAG TPA: flagellar hook-basal body complex protein FliE [Tepidisphaeraceae bacterium]|jgi:flagellar hook-basal body complex protein FliE|nr:flagellar hook-basal body complex protein FliE [Tepidisphaeraceae bacterium]